MDRNEYQHGLRRRSQTVLLAAQPGTFNGGVLVAAYTASGNVGIYYDADANDAGGAVLVATLQGVTNTSSLAADDFHFIA